MTINDQQFKLFMSGQEWQAAATDSVDLGFAQTGKRAPTNMRQLWSQKLDEAKVPEGTMARNGYKAHGAGIYDSMSEKGYVHNPEPYDNPTLFVRGHDLKQGEGHHRIAAAAEIERQTGKPIWIPTTYK